MSRGAAVWPSDRKTLGGRNLCSTFFPFSPLGSNKAELRQPGGQRRRLTVTYPPARLLNPQVSYVTTPGRCLPRFGVIIFAPSSNGFNRLCNLMRGGGCSEGHRDSAAVRSGVARTVDFAVLVQDRTGLKTPDVTATP